MKVAAPALLAAVSLLACAPRELRIPPAGDGGGTDTMGAVGTPLPAGLTPADVARKLSLYLWERPADAALTDEVYAHPPATTEDVRRLATAMLADPRARAGVGSFFHNWLGLDGLATARKDPAAFPEYTPALRDAMIGEAEAFCLHVTFEGDGRFPTLLTASYTMMNEALAPLYAALGVTGPELRKVELDPAQRAGVLTLSGVLADLPDAAAPPISARGAFMTRLLGLRSPPSPPAVSPPPPPGPNQSTRDWLAMAVGASAACAACHTLIDPPGFAFGHYDALGRFQTTERGLPIDASGSWTVASVAGNGGTDTFLTFDGAPDLARKVAALPAAADAFVKAWFDFVSVVPDDSSFDSARRSFVDADLDIRTLIVAVTATPAFLSR
jgi:hypothetical protein